MVTISYYQLAPSMSKIGKLRSFLKLWVKKRLGPSKLLPWPNSRQQGPGSTLATMDKTLSTPTIRSLLVMPFRKYI